MWHALSFVAESRRVDTEDFIAFAMSNFEKYGISADGTHPEVSTWHVDNLVDDYKKHLAIIQKR